MKTYKFEVIIEEGNDEFWEDLKGRSGCDDVQEALESIIRDGGDPFDPTIRLVEFKEV